MRDACEPQALHVLLDRIIRALATSVFDVLVIAVSGFDIGHCHQVDGWLMAS
jgi:hypothetical protein